ncbi:MAG: glycogen debranching enzyme family protein [Chloroflexi bacterium]|nr:glycogen debranching enzyme family protein [Chloroflexota bacterium]
MRREWLVTNGVGGYAMGSLSGTRTRRYHSFLTASLKPPAQRTVMVANLDTWLDIDGRRSPLVTHEWAAGVVLPDGYRQLESFHLDGAIPVLVWGVGDVRIVQRIWMAHGQNTTYITYTYTRGTSNVRLVIKPLCTCRDHHKLTKGGYHVEVNLEPAPWPNGEAIHIEPHPSERSAQSCSSYRILISQGKITSSPEWWWSFHLSEEKRRGLDNQEDLFSPATINAELSLGNTLALVLTAEAGDPLPWYDALQVEQRRQRDLLERAQLHDAPHWIRQLALAADQFIVSRDIGGQSGKTILAGYPWFSDWGRDTMIALPGLTVALGRVEDSAAILRTYARYADQGMLPNRFPDEGQAPEYNTVDATLWYFCAIYACHQAGGCDRAVLEELYEVLTGIIQWHISGTRFQIHQDSADGLLYAGEPVIQLTWMDAKINDWVVTPRVGKPVEINALWYNALRIAAELAAALDRPDDVERYRGMAERAYASFNARFWYSGGYLYDVVDAPDGDDPTLRPNQLLAVSLPFPLLEGEKARAVVDICARELVMSYGLRTLAPDEADYVGTCGGDPLQRDSSYHQGTAWGWLIGPFVSAHYRVYGNALTAWSYLEPLADHLNDGGMGTISEIFDGDPPHNPRGCIAQAWSVAEVLRVYRELESALAAAKAEKQRED